MWAEWCCVVLFLLLAYHYYDTGNIPSTDPYWVKQVELYYLTTMRARTCAEVVQAMDSLSSDVVDYMKHNSEALEVKFPRTPLQHHVLSLQCVDRDGDVLAF
jgi:hypothetical protein